MFRRHWAAGMLVCCGILWAQSDHVPSATTETDVITLSNEAVIGTIDVAEIVPKDDPRSVHHRMNVQGYLTDNSGNPISGNIPMRFSIWDAYTGGTMKWGYEYDTVGCSNGLFSFLIGGKTAINPSVFTGGNYRTLEITIYSTTMPRIVIATVGYAYMAGKSDSSAWAYNADKLEGYHGATTGTSIYTRTESTGKLNTGVIPAITSSMIQDGTIANADLANNAVNSAKIQDGSVTGADLQDGTIGNADLASNAVNSAKIQDNTVTSADIQDGTIQPQDMGFSTGTGDITAVYADNGLTGSATSGDAHLNVGAGTGITVTSDAVNVTVPLNLSGSSSSYIIRGYNSSTGAALTGVSVSGDGVHGQSDGSGDGVYGISTSGNGVWGTSSNLNGVYGKSYNGRGIFGESQNSYGGLFSTSASYAAVYGDGTSRGVWGRAFNTSGDRHGGYFDCGSGAYAYVAYTFATGTKYKIIGDGNVSCVMPTRDGEKVLFAPECPEPYFEDFGNGQLKNGRCHIDLDPLFQDCIRTDASHPIKVFVQPNDECNGLYVKAGETGFDVYELQNGTSNATFTYRVVANKKDTEYLRFPAGPGPMPADNLE